MSETPETNSEAAVETSAVVAPEVGPVSQWLNREGFDHEALDPDHLGIEQIGVEAEILPIVAAAFYFLHDKIFNDRTI